MHGVQAKNLLGICHNKERLVALLDPNGVLQSNESNNSTVAGGVRRFMSFKVLVADDSHPVPANDHPGARGDS